MALATDRIAAITENLTDAGLDNNGIAQCLEMLDKKEFSALQKFLSGYRRKLLDSVHKCNEQIDRLDYFTYQLRKTEESL